MSLQKIVIALLGFIAVACTPHVQQSVPPTRDVFVSSGQTFAQAPPAASAPAAPCAATSHVTQTSVTPSVASNPKEDPTLPQRDVSRPDPFDAAGVVVAASSRFVYDSASGAWRWIRQEASDHHDDIEEAKHKAGQAIDNAKDRASKGLQEIRNEYDKMMGNVKK